MKSCRECVHGTMQKNELVRCDYPIPVWISQELCGLAVGGTLADHLYLWTEDCPTYQPREERETNP